MGSMMATKGRRSFAGAVELVAHAEAATYYLKELYATSANGDKAAARRALRQAISKLEVARALLQVGLE
jgi:hypothetical protein